MVFRNSILSIALLLLAGCAHSPNTYWRQIDLGANTTANLTSGDLRLVMTRDRSTTPEDKVFCSEPSPDFATAIATALNVTGSGSAPSGPSASASVNSTSAETITQLAGRTAGVLALRDGLYATCQAYANGVLGKDAYALVLSQYGNLLLGLVGASAPSTASSGAPSGSTSSTPDAATGNTGTKSSGAGPSAETPAQAAVQSLFVACVSNFDSTRHTDVGENNAVLDKATCSKLVQSIADNATVLLLAGAKPDQPGIAGATCSAQPSGKALVIAYQTALKKAGDDPGSLDGVVGKKTAAALLAYQKANGLPQTSKADAATLAKLKLACPSP